MFPWLRLCDLDPAGGARVSIAAVPTYDPPKLGHPGWVFGVP
jgi:hypothetical protein